MNRMIFGIFRNEGDAENTVTDLKRLGYDPKDISIVMKDKREAKDLEESTGASVAGGAASGAVTGSVIGGIAGLLIGLGAIAIPGIGALLIGGPIAAALGLSGAAATTVSGAVTGALAGGLIGALTNIGVPEKTARYYEDRIREGGILVAVPATSEREDEVRQVLDDNGADQIETVSISDRDFESWRDETRKSARHQTSGIGGGPDEAEEERHR